MNYYAPPKTQRPTPKSHYDSTRNLITIIAAVVSFLVFVIAFYLHSRYVLSYKDGQIEWKMALAASLAMVTAISLFGVIFMLSLSFAPRSWILHSKTGQAWINRTGLKNKTSDKPLRILSTIVALCAAAVLFGNIMLLLSHL